MTAMDQAASADAKPLAEHQALVLLLLAYTLSIADRMILSVLFRTHQGGIRPQ